MQAYINILYYKNNSLLLFKPTLIYNSTFLLIKNHLYEKERKLFSIYNIENIPL